MALPLQVVDVFLSALSQVAADHQGPVGRLTDLRNVKVSHYTPPTRVSGLQLKVDPRDGFSSLAATARSVVDGSTVAASWSTPELLDSLGSQLVSVDGAIPRVWNGSAWTYYGSTRTLTQILSQDVVHTSQHTIQAPDSAWMGGVTCFAWTETVVTSAGPLTTSYVGFRADNGAWVRQATVLYASTSPLVPTQARVLQDGASFWVFFNTDTVVVANVYDTSGSRLVSSSVIPLPPHTAGAPGVWDATVTPTTGGYTVLCATLADATSDAGVELYAAKLSGGTVAYNHVTIGPGTITADWRLAFLTNDTGNGKAYLVSVNSRDSGVPSAIHGYEITSQAVTRTYDCGNADAVNEVVDSVAGYVTSSTGVAIIVSYSLLAGNVYTPGPPHDPQLRRICSLACVAPTSVTQLRTTQSLTQVSRAFAVDGEYYVVGYYQSGSGVTWTPVTHTFNPMLGDYMIGAASQSITVRPGDKTIGSAIALSAGPSNPTVYVSNSTGTIPIQAGDTVAGVTVNGAAPYGIPDGTLMLRWHFANHSAATLDSGSRLTLSGSSISGANTTWDVAFVQSGYFYTVTNDINGNFPLAAGGTFTATGTIQLVAMAGYQVQDLSSTISGQTVAPFIGGSVVIAGASHSGNNGTFTVARVYYGQGPNWAATFSGQGYVWVVKGAQVTANDAFSGTLTPTNVNQWTFATGTFDSSYVGADLVVSADAQVAINVGTYPITAVTNPTQLVTGSTTSVLPQVFQVPFPSVSVELTTQVPYTFALGEVTPDYSYLNAVVAVQGAVNPNNDGTYRVTQVNADGTFVAVPTNGTSDQVNEAFGPSQTITIFLNPTPAPQFQPTWFLVPITGAQPVAGRFEYGLAYADWRVEGDSADGGSLFPFAVTTPQVTPAGVEFVLPYRAENVTSADVVATPAGPVVVPGQESTTNTVGLKSFTLSTDTGHAYATSDQLSIPGPMATLFTSSGFFEDGISVAPEQPFLVSQSVASSGQLALTPRCDLRVRRRLRVHRRERGPHLLDPVARLRGRDVGHQQRRHSRRASAVPSQHGRQADRQHLRPDHPERHDQRLPDSLDQRHADYYPLQGHQRPEPERAGPGHVDEPERFLVPGLLHLELRRPEPRHRPERQRAPLHRRGLPVAVPIACLQPRCGVEAAEVGHRVRRRDLGLERGDRGPGHVLQP